MRVQCPGWGFHSAAHTWTSRAVATMQAGAAAGGAWCQQRRSVVPLERS